MLDSWLQIFDYDAANGLLSCVVLMHRVHFKIYCFLCKNFIFGLASCINQNCNTNEQHIHPPISTGLFDDNSIYEKV